MDEREKTTVVATFSHRHDAEIAGDRLQRAQIRSFISADDAGGTHPHLQQTHGVKLLVLDRKAREARSILEAEDLVSGPSDDTATDADPPRRDSSRPHEAREAGISGPKVVLTVAVVILVLALVITALVV